MITQEIIVLHRSWQTLTDKDTAAMFCLFHILSWWLSTFTKSFPHIYFTLLLHAFSLALSMLVACNANVKHTANHIWLISFYLITIQVFFSLSQKSWALQLTQVTQKHHNYSHTFPVKNLRKKTHLLQFLSLQNYNWLKITFFWDKTSSLYVTCSRHVWDERYRRMRGGKGDRGFKGQVLGLELLHSI